MKKSNQENTLIHLFSKYELDLDFKDYNESSVNISLQKVNNDTYLKVFDSNIVNNPNAAAKKVLIKISENVIDIAKLNDIDSDGQKIIENYEKALFDLAEKGSFSSSLK